MATVSRGSRSGWDRSDDLVRISSSTSWDGGPASEQLQYEEYDRDPRSRFDDRDPRFDNTMSTSSARRAERGESLVRSRSSRDDRDPRGGKEDDYDNANDSRESWPCGTRGRGETAGDRTMDKSGGGGPHRWTKQDAAASSTPPLTFPNSIQAGPTRFSRFPPRSRFASQERSRFNGVNGNNTRYHGNHENRYGGINQNTSAASSSGASSSSRRPDSRFDQEQLSHTLFGNSRPTIARRDTVWDSREVPHVRVLRDRRGRSPRRAGARVPMMPDGGGASAGVVQGTVILERSRRGADPRLLRSRSGSPKDHKQIVGGTDQNSPNKVWAEEFRAGEQMRTELVSSSSVRDNPAASRFGSPFKRHRSLSPPQQQSESYSPSRLASPLSSKESAPVEQNLPIGGATSSMGAAASSSSMVVSTTAATTAPNNSGFSSTTFPSFGPHATRPLGSRSRSPGTSRFPIRPLGGHWDRLPLRSRLADAPPLPDSTGVPAVRGEQSAFSAPYGPVQWRSRRRPRADPVRFLDEHGLNLSLANLGGPAYHDRTVCDDAICPVSQLEIWTYEEDSAPEDESSSPVSSGAAPADSPTAAPTSPGRKKRPNLSDIPFLFSYVETHPDTGKEFIRGFSAESFQQLLLNSQKTGKKAMKHPVSGLLIPESARHRGAMFVQILVQNKKIPPVLDEDPTTWSLDFIRTGGRVTSGMMGGGGGMAAMMGGGGPSGTMGGAAGSSSSMGGVGHQAPKYPVDTPQNLIRKLAFSVFQIFYTKNSIEIPEDAVCALSLKDLKALAKEVKGMYLRNFDASQRRQLCPDGNASAFLEQPWYSNDPIPWQFYILSNLHYVLAGRKPGAPEPPEYLVKMAMYVFVAAIATVSQKVREQYADSFSLDFDMQGDGPHSPGPGDLPPRLDGGAGGPSAGSSFPYGGGGGSSSNYHGAVSSSGVGGFGGGGGNFGSSHSSSHGGAHGVRPSMGGGVGGAGGTHGGTHGGAHGGAHGGTHNQPTAGAPTNPFASHGGGPFYGPPPRFM